MDSPLGLMLVCGLGGLARASLRTLQRFGVPLRCLDLRRPDWLEGDGFAELAANLVIGDMRSPAALLRAGVREARSVLLLTADSGVNLEAALQVRLLNPDARVVVRSSGGLGLERHLRERVPGLALVDPQLLTAGVFANALRTDGSEAAFSLGSELFRIRREVLQSDGAEDLFTLQGRQRHLLQWCPTGSAPGGDPASQWWDLQERPRKGDHLLWLELVSPLELRRASKGGWIRLIHSRLRLSLETLQESLLLLRRRWDWWHVAGVAALALVLLAGSAWFGNGLPSRGLLLTLAMLKGEYLDALGAMTGGTPIEPAHLGLAALSLTFALGGTLFTAWLVAWVVDWLLARRLGRREPGPPPAGSSFVLLVEGNRLALRLEGLLLRTRARVMRVQADNPRDASPAFSSLERALRLVRHGRCQAMAVLGDDLMANLETALNLQERFPLAKLAVRSDSGGHGAPLGPLFPDMDVISPQELSAEAVVATAFGERVREVLRLADCNLLLTSYVVEAGDTLVGRSLSAVAAGYGLMPLSLTHPGPGQSQFLPSLELVLRPGDSLVVLAPLSGLRAVEAGQMRQPAWRLEIQGMGPRADLFEGKMLLARHFDRPPGEMGLYLECQQGPRQTPPLHQESGRRLEARLRQLGFQCALIPDSDSREGTPDGGNGSQGLHRSGRGQLHPQGMDSPDAIGILADGPI
jgi:voltage-gated potassium channel Kch